MRKLQKYCDSNGIGGEGRRVAGSVQGGKANETARYRYRHKDIKTALLEECGWKCVYCESKIWPHESG